MITFDMIDDEFSEFLSSSGNEVYVMKKDGEILGYGKINSDIRNRLQIFIFPEYRGNGYGKILFGKLVDLFGNSDPIYLTFMNNNLRALRIASKFGAMHKDIVEGVSTYVIPPRKMT